MPTLRREEDDQSTLRTQLAALHCAGVPVNWQSLYQGGNLVDVPTIAFDRRPHWADAGHPTDRADAPSAQLLRLGPDTEVSTVVTMTAPDRAQCEILARNEDGDWERQADAVLHSRGVRPELRPRSVDAMNLRHPVTLDPAELYHSLRRRGLEHGPAFTGFRRLHTTRHGDSYWAEVDVARRVASPPHGLPVHHGRRAELGGAITPARTRTSVAVRQGAPARSSPPRWAVATARPAHRSPAPGRRTRAPAVLHGTASTPP